MSRMTSAVRKIAAFTKFKERPPTETPSVQSQPKPISVTRSVVNVEGSADNYREPLMYYIQDSGNNYGATCTSD